MFQIVKVPNSVLTTSSKPVEKIDKKVVEVIEGMKRALVATKNPKGVGLAAPQVGKSLRIFITKPTPKSPFSVFINPEIQEASTEKTEGVPRPASSEKPDNKFEGCLSIPNIWGVVYRHQSVKVAYQDETGKNHTKTFKGFIATIIQHETDHINGILFTQRVLEQKNKLYKITGKDKEGKDVFKEIDV